MDGGMVEWVVAGRVKEWVWMSNLSENGWIDSTFNNVELLFFMLYLLYLFFIQLL